jgi:hypothetical protein
MPYRYLPSAAFLCLLTFAPIASAAEPPVDFARQIKPILAAKCLACHGPDQDARKAGLRLDTREGALAETESGGLAIMAGNPAKSELLDRVAHADPDLRMPPKEIGKEVTPAEAALLKRWIAEGAEYRPHWAFVPPQRAALPVVKQSQWPENAIDRFVLARLEQEGLSPSESADRYALARRLYLDLLGVPPTIAEADAFVADRAPDAYERKVDELLASPRFGERWAHVWLDQARYADSAGYAQDPPRTIWRYRDWVVSALNKNLPFDQFTVEQLAGDMLEHPNDAQLIATAFHRNTMTNSEGGTDDEEFRNAAIIDRVNTTMQVWMGMTMGCAQCHTHKYDPITQQEYFRFYAVFNQTQDADRGDESPLLMTPSADQLAENERLTAEIAKLEKQIAEKAVAEVKPPARSGELKTRFVRVELPGKGVYLHLAEVQAFAGGANVATSGKATQKSTGFEGPPQYAIDGNTDGDYKAKSVSHTGENESDPWWEVDLGTAQAVTEIVLHNRTDAGSHARLANFRVIALDNEHQPVWVTTVATSPNPSAKFELPKTFEAFTDKQKNEVTTYFAANSASPEVQQWRAKLDAAKKQIAGLQGVSTPIFRELPTQQQRKTFLQYRGNFMDKGPEVQAGVPAVFPPLPSDAPVNRLTVARWLVDSKNPLTARVAVNRCWEQLFGMGIVETSEDFGVQGEPPSHPELLDYLAVELMHTGWDTKALIKQIVTSATYRQTSKVSRPLRERDPFNRLLARGPRTRLSAEHVRDQALAASGLLSAKMFGASVQPPRPKLGLASAFGGSTDWETSPGEDKYRRGLYTSWRRTTPYPSMTTFDATSREVCTIRRIATNTPLQALVTLNDPVYVEAAQALARRMIVDGGATPRERAIYGFRLCVTRPPSEAETARLVKLYEDSLTKYKADATAAMQMATDPLGPLPAGINPAEAAAWSVVGNVLLNLDEVLAKR